MVWCRYAEHMNAPAKAETLSDDSRGDSGSWGGAGFGSDAGGAAARGAGGEREREPLLGTLTPVLVSMLVVVVVVLLLLLLLLPRRTGVGGGVGICLRRFWYDVV